MKDILFETERLIVRKLKKGDLEGFHRLHSNVNVMSPIPADTLSYAEAEQEMLKIIENYPRLDSKVSVYAVERKLDHSFLGTCAIISPQMSDAEIGYRIREKYWRQGFGTEIAKGVIDHLFKNSDIKSVYAEVSERNIGSKKILSKLMQKSQETFNGNDGCLDLEYRISREQWQESEGNEK